MAVGVIGSLSRAAAHALLSIGEYGQARGLAAARDDDRPSADIHIGEAEAAGARLGADGNYVWTAFGPTNVKIHQVCVAMEFGDVQRAIEIAPSLDTSRLPIERRVRHAIETVVDTVVRLNGRRPGHSRASPAARAAHPGRRAAVARSGRGSVVSVPGPGRTAGRSGRY
jgi:hypothetical protein